MHKKHKRILLVTVILVAAVLAAVIGARYIPFNKIFKVSGTPESSFVNRQQISADVPHTLYFDFEVDPKSANAGALYKGIAHSGHYSIKAFGKNSYSLSVERKAGDIGLENLGAVAMSAWVYIFPGKNEPLGNLVFAASNENINVLWKGINVSGHDLPRGKWFKISGLFDISDVKFKPGYKLVMYFWNNSNTDFLLDDFYIVFGGAKPRKGDTTLVDLTHGNAFTPKFNFPPYPFHYFIKEETGAGNSSFLVNKDKSKEGDLNPDDRIFRGHFVSEAGSAEDLLVIGKTGKAELYVFCRESKDFRKITLVVPPELQAWFQNAVILPGCFSGDGTQLVLSGPNGMLLGEFDKIRNTCTGESRASFNVLVKTSVTPFPAGKNTLLAADLEGRKSDDVLATSADGSWKIYRIDKGKKEVFTLVASGTADPLHQWDSRTNEVRITAGRFLQKFNQDILLTVSREKSKPGNSWSLQRFDPVSRSFISCYGDKQNHMGKTIGMDTLKPSDEFIAGIFDKGGKVKIFRYNRDWRYDLKEIRFNDSTFQVIANMDFAGYEKDYNPKYYEVLKLLPLQLVPGRTSLLVIGKNRKLKDAGGNKTDEFINLPALPSRIGVYSFLNTEK